jgi:dipeptidyl aminopeptidase/acylaminoacyl peptidase
VGGERCCILLNACADRRKFLFLATQMLDPVDIHVFDGVDTRLTHINRELLAEWPTVHPRHLNFRSADGLDLEGWFLADASDSGPRATVLFIHGGPFNAAGHAYRFDLHLLASHGFGVLCANFRGSFGYGEAFALAIMGDWGARGFPDHMATVEHAVQSGLVDPGRIGVWGASHGGFATCWLICHSDRFRAAVAEAAVTNLATVYYLSDAPETFSRDLGGKPHEIPDVYRSRSPLTYAHRCKTPTLLIHGENDLRCPIAEAEQFYRALLDVGCVSEMVRLRHASHLGDSIGPPSTRVGQNAALLEWFKRFL